MLTSLLITTVTLIVAYGVFSAILLNAELTIPGTGLTLGTLYWIVALAIISLFFMSLLGNLIRFFGPEPGLFLRAFPFLTMRQVSLMKRLLIQLVIVIVLLTTFLVVSPYIGLIPAVGSYLRAAAQVITGAVVVLFFWDIGRSLYSELETVTAQLEEKLE